MTMREIPGHGSINQMLRNSTVRERKEFICDLCVLGVRMLLRRRLLKSRVGVDMIPAKEIFKNGRTDTLR